MRSPRFSISSPLRHACIQAWIVCCLCAAAIVRLAAAAEAPQAQPLPPEQVEFFEKKIRPLLSDQCLKCHSTAGDKIKGGLLLDNRAAILKGGDTGPAAIPGNPEKSLIMQAVRYSDEDLQMPPKHRLAPEQVADLEHWIRMGLPDPRDGAASAPAPQTAINFEEARKFWSLQPVKDPAVPEIRDGAWARNPVDRFLLAKLQEKKLHPNPDTSRRQLLRRATYDLTGLPPTPEEMDAFLADTSPDAFAKLVDRLLASPHYGEQWGRHWLDVVRYADTSGCNSDFPVPSAYRYRNYVIDAFNRDKPYDAFIREQIAGDLLPSASEAERYEHIIATGYLAIARRFGSRASEFHLTIDDMIDNLGKGVLGLSLGCARCHDHKFDPVATKDYYALYGIFDSTKYAFPGTEIYRHQKDFVPLAPPDISEQFNKDSAELGGLDDRIEQLKEEKKRVERDETRLASLPETDPASPKFIGPPANAPAEHKTSKSVQSELNAAQKRQLELEAGQDRVEKAYAVAEGKPHNARIQKKGEPGNLGAEAPRAFLTVLGGQPLPESEQGSGRLELAGWLADAKNPLTARVMVNRIWQHHFGKGLVKSANDFGVRGERPANPELLDWLASRFIESGWSVKAMHRLIMLSHAYQMSSEDNAEESLADVNDDYLWRYNRQRLSAEELRDSMLYVSGSLDTSPAGAHPFPPAAGWHYTQHNPFIADYPTAKRSVYLMQQRIRKQPYLDIFDGADTNATTGVRPLSTTPIQALFMMNNPFAHETAGKLADRVESAGPELSQRIDQAYRLVFCRPAEPDEIKMAQEYLAQVSEALKEAGVPAEQQPHAAFASLARVLLSSNEFLFVE